MATALTGAGGLVDAADLAAYRVVEREAVCGTYRGYEILGPPPPASSGVHVVQMLNVLEGFDVGALGFGTADAVHLLAEVMKIAFADRAVATADPTYVDVPVARLVDKAYAGGSASSRDTTVQPMASAYSRILAWTVLCSPGVGTLNSGQCQPCRQAWYSAGRRR